MKKIFLFCLFTFTIAGTILAANAPTSLNNEPVFKEDVSVTDSRPVQVAFYEYYYQTGEFVCQGFGYVRTENGKLIIYVASQGDCDVNKSNLPEYQYMFSCTLSGRTRNMYFNL